MSKTLEGKSALVTGAGRGIGRASAMMLAREGARVVVSDIEMAVAEEVAAEIRDSGEEAHAFACDVSDAAQVEALVNFAIEKFGSLDCAHNNAGISLPSQPFTDIEIADWEKVMATNLSSVFYCMKYEIAQMLKQGENGEGSIVNTASGAALVPAPGQPHYTAAKRGILGLTTHASDEYKHTKIRFNAILPGMVKTTALGAWMESSPEEAKAVLSVVPQHRLAEPEEIAEAVVWLCSDRAAWISGDSMVVDGGLVNR